MKSHIPADAKLLMGILKGFKDAWRLGVLHIEYERFKKIEEEKIAKIDSKKILLKLKQSASSLLEYLVI